MSGLMTSLVLLSFFSPTVFLFFFFCLIISKDTTNLVEIFSKFWGASSIQSSLFILSIWIIYLSLYSQKFIGSNMKSFSFLFFLSMMLILLGGVFFSNSFIMFYIFFESVFLITFLVIINWGSSPEKIQACMYMLFYTLSASFPLLMAILFQSSKLPSSTFDVIWAESNEGWIGIVFLLVFLIKLPMFTTHLWLPKAHVEAPIAGSMILAGILLKIGGYGIFLLMKSFSSTKMPTNWMWSSIGISSLFLVSLICMKQTDLKMIIAFSSISHMGLVIIALFLSNMVSTQGAIFLMVAHGLSSSGMFYCMNLFYTQMKTRNISSTKGSLEMNPKIIYWWFLFMAVNMSAPPSLNFISESLIISGTGSGGWLFLLILGMSVFLVSIFSLFLFQSSFNSSENKKQTNFSMSMSEHALCFLHLSPLLMLILWVNFF